MEANVGEWRRIQQLCKQLFKVVYTVAEYASIFLYPAELLLLVLCFTSTVNSYGHIGTVS